MWLYCALFIFLTPTLCKDLHKRQLFREQLLPNLGGKVPESAFWVDRLALNQLNARGIYSSTGIYLEHRQHKADPHITSAHPTMKVQVPPDDRYIAEPGRYFYESSRTLDTTYSIRDPVSSAIKPNFLHNSNLFIPYTSLKLRKFYYQKKFEKNRNFPWNVIENVNDFNTQAHNEFGPYLMKLHELD